jgi:hypothetical protein
VHENTPTRRRRKPTPIETKQACRALYPFAAAAAAHDDDDDDDDEQTTTTTTIIDPRR